MSRPTLHGSAVLVGEHGVLVRGEAGSGKSSLVLALVDGDAFARLIADDRVALTAASGRLVASAPAALAGLIEIRGQGIARRPFVSPAVIRMIVDLVPAATVPRMPAPEEARATLEGIELPRVLLAARAGDQARLLRAALVALRANHL